ncbi:HigA family addiction module antidote protein [Variovorax paradoxus]|nr:HigA family addiction module antidote protein [Variovorax paradoxus]
MFKNGMRPVHPGEVLREDYLKPLNLSANALAKALHVPPSRIGDILLRRRGVTADTALRLTRYFGGDEADAQGWLNLQAEYDFKMTALAEGKAIAKEIKPRADLPAAMAA